MAWRIRAANLPLDLRQSGQIAKGAGWLRQTEKKANPMVRHRDVLIGTGVLALAGAAAVWTGVRPMGVRQIGVRQIGGRQMRSMAAYDRALAAQRAPLVRSGAQGVQR